MKLKSILTNYRFYYIVSAILLLVAMILLWGCALTDLLAFYPDKYEEPVTTLMLAVFLLSIVGFVAAILCLANKNGHIKSRRSVKALLFFSIFTMIFFFPSTNYYSSFMPNRGCGFHLQEIYRDIQLSGVFSANWCDCLLKQQDAKWLGCLKCSRDSNDTSTYALNKDAIGKTVDELPSDLILFFETEDSWNKTGGIDDAKFGRHYPQKCNAILANGCPVGINCESILDYRWSIQGGDRLPPDIASILNVNRYYDYSAKAFLGLAVLAYLAISVKYRCRLRFIFGLLAALSGAVCYGITKLISMSDIYPFGADLSWTPIVGGIIGIGSACVYYFILERLLSKGSLSKDVVIYFGAIVGLVASAVVHLCILIYTHFCFLPPLLIGGACGVVVGIMLGLIAWLHYKYRIAIVSEAVAVE